MIHPYLAKPFVEFSIEVAIAYKSNLIPNFDKLYGILEDVLNPKEKNKPRVVFDWLSRKEKTDARKLPIVKIDSIM